jgi:beta-N-acetylhexosaminidase
MSLGPVMMGLDGMVLTAEEREMLRHPHVGGVILFTRNYTDTEQLRQLTRDIHQLRDPHLIIAVDHEGGRVQRFRNGFTALPPLAAVGALYDREPKAALKSAEDLGWLMAAELLQHGVDISFAPVLDLDYGVSAVMRDRCFHRDAQIVARLAQAYVHGMKDAGMVATGKHFPGHGAVGGDSHTEQPHDLRPLADLMLADIIPFERLIANGLAGIMPAHVVYNSVDPKPAGYSRCWLQDILRTQLRFQGVIFSDDLDMAGADLHLSPIERAHAALDAGCDMVLACNVRQTAIAVLDGLQQYNNPVAQMRLVRLHGKAADKPESRRLAAAQRLAVDLSANPNQNFEMNV